MTSMRRGVANFLYKREVSNFILGMVILLCIVIFTELSISSSTDENVLLQDIFYYTNYVLLSFFMVEISLRLFAESWLFLQEWINVFDSLIVVTSFIMIALRIEAKILGILRILRLIKVIIEMKKVADEKKEKQEMIKEQKKQGSGMASYVERVLDFLEKITEN